MLGIEPACSIYHFKDYRVVIRDVRLEVVKHEVELQLIARAPHTAVGISKSGDTFFDRFACHIKAAIRKGIAVV